jgi:hypothetical protein
MLSGGAQVAGIGYTDIAKGLNTKITISKIPATEGNEAIYAVGMFDVKGTGFIIGIPATGEIDKIKPGATGAGAVDILDFIGARVKKGDYAIAAWAGNMLVDKNKAEKAWGKDSVFANEKPFGIEVAKTIEDKVVGVTYTKPKENAYIVEGYYGNKMGWRVGLERGEIDKLSMYGVSGTIPFANNLFLKAMLGYGTIKDSENPTKDLNQQMGSVKLWWPTNWGYLSGELTHTNTYSGGMSYPVTEFFVKFQMPFGLRVSNKKEKK